MSGIKGPVQYALENVKLPDKPLISFDNIQSYDWKNHELFLTEDGWKKIKEGINAEDLKSCKYCNFPFVFTINRRPIYIGFFWSYFSSDIPKGPIVHKEEIQNNRFVIIYDQKFKNYKDVVANPELYNFLVKNKKIKNK